MMTSWNSGGSSNNLNQQGPSLLASEGKSWLSRTLNLGKTISRKYAQGTLYRDFQEGWHQGYIEHLSKEQVKEWFHRNAGAPPGDIEWILKQTGFRPVWETKHLDPCFQEEIKDPVRGPILLQSFAPQWAPRDTRRAILEVCAVKMSTDEREQFLATYGEDGLYRILRYYWRWPSTGVGVRGTLMKQCWYKVTDEGDLKQVNGLYEVIQCDPNAFLELMK